MAILGPLNFYMNFRIILPVSGDKKEVEIVIDITFNMRICRPIGEYFHLNKIMFLIHEYGIFFILLRFYLPRDYLLLTIFWILFPHLVKCSCFVFYSINMVYYTG